MAGKTTLYLMTIRINQDAVLHREPDKGGH